MLFLPYRNLELWIFVRAVVVSFQHQVSYSRVNLALNSFLTYTFHLPLCAANPSSAYPLYMLLWCYCIWFEGLFVDISCALSGDLNTCLLICVVIIIITTCICTLTPHTHLNTCIYVYTSHVCSWCFMLLVDK